MVVCEFHVLQIRVYDLSYLKNLSAKLRPASGPIVLPTPSCFVYTGHSERAERLVSKCIILGSLGELGFVHNCSHPSDENKMKMRTLSSRLFTSIR